MIFFLGKLVGVDHDILLQIIARIDQAEQRLMSRIEALEQFKWNVIGGAMVFSGLVSLTIQLWKG